MSWIIIALLFLSACEPRDIRLLQDSERSKKGVFPQNGKQIFLGDASAAAFALEKQIEIINVLEMTVHHESAAEAGYIFIDESRPTRKNAVPAFIFHQDQSLSDGKSRQDSFGQWRASVTREPLRLQGMGHVSLYLLPLPDSSAPPLEAPIADVKAHIEREIVEITSDRDNANLFYIEIKLMKITFTKEIAKPFLTEVNIASKLTVRREITAGGQPARYTITDSSISFSNNKVRHGNPIRTLNLTVSENFSVQLGACPYVVGTLSLIKNQNKIDLIRFKEDAILNLNTEVEEKLIPCTDSTVRPLVDLSRTLRM